MRAVLALLLSQVSGPSFGAHADYVRALIDRYDRGALRILTAQASRGDAFARCSVTALNIEWGLRPRADLFALRERPETRQCATYYLALVTPPDSLSAAQRAAAQRVTPGQPLIQLKWTDRYIAAGRYQAAEQLALEGLRTARNPEARIALSVRQIVARRLRGDSAAARSLLDALNAAVARDGRLAVRLYLAEAAEKLVRSRPELAALRQEQLRLVRLLGDSDRIAKQLNAMAAEHIDAGDPASGLALADSALRHARQSKPSQRLTRALVLRGRAAAKLGAWERAAADLTEARRIAAHYGITYDEADALHNLAHTFEGRGDWRRAVAYADQFAAVAQHMPGDPIAVISLRDAGIIKWRSGQIEAARRSFQTMVQRIEARGANFVWAGEYFERMNDLPRARHYFRRAVLEGGDSARALSGLTRAHLLLGDLDSAQVTAAQHAQTRLTPEEVLLTPVVLARRARLAEAVSLAYGWALRQEGAGNRVGAANAWLQAAELSGTAGRYADMSAYARHAERHARAVNDLSVLATARALRAQGLARAGNPAGALALLRQDSAGAQLVPPAARLALHLATADVYSALRMTQPALDAYELAADAAAAAAAPLATDFERVRFAAGNISPYQRALELVLRENLGVDTVLYWSARKKNGAVQRPWFTPSIAEHQALLDYVVIGQQIVVNVVTPTARKSQLLSANPAETLELVNRLRQPFSHAYFGRIDLARARFDSTAARALYDRLIAPIERELAGARELLISPDGALALLPFDALMSGRPRPSYLIERFTVTYVPAANWLPGADRALRLHPGSVAAFATDAPGAQREIATMRALFPSHPEPATEQRVRGALIHADVLHIAAHARTSIARPLESFIALVPGEGEDGLLHASEIAALRTRARLAILTGCETGAGRLFEGSGIAGLSRAFLAAGAQTVIATHWPLSEAAADWTAEFYRRLARGTPQRLAAREARMALLRNPKTAHPFFWAGYLVAAGAGQ